MTAQPSPGASLPSPEQPLQQPHDSSIRSYYVQYNTCIPSFLVQTKTKQIGTEKPHHQHHYYHHYQDHHRLDAGNFEPTSQVPLVQSTSGISPTLVWSGRTRGPITGRPSLHSPLPTAGLTSTWPASELEARLRGYTIPNLESPVHATATPTLKSAYVCSRYGHGHRCKRKRKPRHQPRREIRDRESLPGPPSRCLPDLVLGPHIPSFSIGGCSTTTPAQKSTNTRPRFFLSPRLPPHPRPHPPPQTSSASTNPPASRSTST